MGSRTIGGRKNTCVYISLGIFACSACIGLGILFGYLIVTTRRSSQPSVTRDCVNGTIKPTLSDCREEELAAEKCEPKLARSTVAYHLNGKTINIDGMLGDPAWADVQPVGEFVDLRGVDFPTPTFATEVKLRWDDDYLYVYAFLHETHVWAFKTQDETHVWKDNAFEVYVDSDGSTHNYKEMQINALEKTWDLMLTKAYIDGGKAESSWDSQMVKAVFVSGSVNDPTDKDSYWSVEMKIPFHALMYNTTRKEANPDDNEIWRVVLARVEWKYRIDNATKKYVKLNATESKAEWWSWNPHGAVNLHLPDRWGYVQFSRAAPKSAKFVPSKRIRLEKALFDMFNAMKAYRAVYGVYTDQLSLLHLPLYLRKATCFRRPEIVVGPWKTTFTLSINTAERVGYIRDDRYVWYIDIAAR